MGWAENLMLMDLAQRMSRPAYCPGPGFTICRNNTEYMYIYIYMYVYKFITLLY